jgi:uncharacterized iron-regulated membrane protein
MLRRLHRWHRYLGFTLGALFLAWFLSGMVMMYVGFPALLAEERRRGLSPLPEHWPVSVEQAARAASLAGPPGRIRLGAHLGRPLYHFQALDGGPWNSVYADTGESLGSVPSGEAIQVAREFWQRARGGHAEMSDSASVASNPIEYDQWTLSTPLNPWRPFHRVVLGDREGTQLYISARTGEVVRDTQRWERGWNYLGAVVHWLYIPALRRHNELWRWVGRSVSGAAILLPLTGWALMRFGPKRRMEPRNPRVRWRVWHRRLGLVFGLPALAWILSGFLSFRIVTVFDDGDVRPDQRERFQGGVSEPQHLRAPHREAVASGPVAACEGEYVGVMGRPHLLLWSRDGSLRRIPSGASDPSVPAAETVALSEDTLRDRASRLLPNAALLRWERLTTSDAHYYCRRPGDEPKPLPVYRACFGDSDSTWFHLDPFTGRVLDRISARARAYRWCFNGLHSWDWPGFAALRPLWDVLVFGLLAGGVALSLLGLRLLIPAKRTLDRMAWKNGPSADAGVASEAGTSPLQGMTHKELR